MYLLRTGVHGNHSICGDATSTQCSVINKLTALSNRFRAKSKVILVSKEY